LIYGDPKRLRVAATPPAGNENWRENKFLIKPIHFEK
jgi:hypothetical protein